MTDRPILFSGPMVRALLDGRKTQTRRIFKPRMECKACNGTGIILRSPGIHGGCPIDCYSCAIDKAQYHPGDRLWVREAWRIPGRFDDRRPGSFPPRELVPVQYEADHKRRFWVYDHGDPGRLRASMHMPRWASRLTLIVTDVRVQRLQTISGRDAVAEGLTFPEGMEWGCHPVEAFRTLWDSLNDKRGFGWSCNPWVAAYTFTVHKQNIDCMGEAA